MGLADATPASAEHDHQQAAQDVEPVAQQKFTAKGAVPAVAAPHAHAPAAPSASDLAFGGPSTGGAKGAAGAGDKPDGDKTGEAEAKTAESSGGDEKTAAESGGEQRADEVSKTAETVKSDSCTVATGFFPLTSKLLSAGDA